MAATRSLRGFAIIVLVMQIFFALIYAFEEGYSQTVSFSDFNGLIAAVFLCMLLLVGFGLLTVYLKQYNITGLILNFIMLAFTIQWYFIIKKFWYCIKLTDTTNMVGLSDNPYNIRLSSILKYSYPTDTSNPVDIKDMKYFTLSQAICCAISMFVILFPMMGKVGPAEAVIITFFGNAGYTLNEAVFWRLNISDNGYGMKIFLFGSLAGIIASLLLGREHTIQNEQYTSSYQNQSLALIGSIFVWILLPWISVVDQNQADSSTFVYDFRQVAPLNIIFALSSSAAASFSTSIWLRGKIAVHDVIFSCFSGAIAYGSSSNVFPNPWPAMLIGMLSGVISTFLNTKMKSINHKGVVDSLGSICIFLIPSVGGAIYSAILYATTAYGPLNDQTYRQVDGQRNRWTHGAYQLVGMGITIGISCVTGLIIALFMRYFNTPENPQELFTDKTYVDKDDSKQLLQTKTIKVK